MKPAAANFWRRIHLGREGNMRGKYIALWTAVGISVGAALGSATGEMGVWVAVGAAVGLSTGFTIAKRKQNLSK